MHDAIRTSDGLGYFFYNKTFRAYVEVISFDRLVNSAKERNKAFFDKLGYLPDDMNKKLDKLSSMSDWGHRLTF